MTPPAKPLIGLAAVARLLYAPTQLGIINEVQNADGAKNMQLLCLNCVRSRWQVDPEVPFQDICDVLIAGTEAHDLQCLAVQEG
jgi:hypothetical protein